MPARRSILTCLIAACVPSLPRKADAHAILKSSVPAANATVPAGRMAVLLVFNSRIDASRSTLVLTTPNKSRTTLPLGSPGGPDELTAAIQVTPGPHVLRWQVLALDGHITRGDLPFSVAGG